MHVKLTEATAQKLAEILGWDRLREEIDVSQITFPDYRTPDINTLGIIINGRFFDFDLDTLDPEHDVTAGAITDLIELVAKMHIPETKPPDAEPDPVRVVDRAPAPSPRGGKRK